MKKIISQKALYLFGVALSLLFCAATVVYAADCTTFGVPQNGFPTWWERSMYTLTNAVRLAPTQYRDTYMPGAGNILTPQWYPAVLPLLHNDGLSLAARGKAFEMAFVPGCPLQHTSCYGDPIISWFNPFYPNAHIIGQNIAGGYTDPMTAIGGLFNRSSALEPQDIFDFLNAWFAGCSALTSAPTAPTLTLPINQALVIAFPSVFIWNLVSYSNPVKYHLQVSTDSDFSPTSIVIDRSNLVTTSHTPTGTFAPGMYFWRVRTIDATNPSNASDYGSPRFFTYTAPAASAVTITTPAINSIITGTSIPVVAQASSPSLIGAMYVAFADPDGATYGLRRCDINPPYQHSAMCNETVTIPTGLSPGPYVVVAIVYDQNFNELIRTIIPVSR